SFLFPNDSGSLHGGALLEPNYSCNLSSIAFFWVRLPRLGGDESGRSRSACSLGPVARDLAVVPFGWLGTDLYVADNWYRHSHFSLCVLLPSEKLADPTFFCSANCLYGIDARGCCFR